MKILEGFRHLNKRSSTQIEKSHQRVVQAPQQIHMKSPSPLKKYKILFWCQAQVKRGNKTQLMAKMKIKFLLPNSLRKVCPTSMVNMTQLSWKLNERSKINKLTHRALLKLNSKVRFKVTASSLIQTGTSRHSTL